MAKARNKFIGGAKRPAFQVKDEDLGFGESQQKAPPIKERLEKDTPLPSKKTAKSFTIKGVNLKTLEAIKNIVYTEKIKGNILCTQSNVIDRALHEFVSNYHQEIIERPQEIKDREEKMATRKKR